MALCARAMRQLLVRSQPASTSAPVVLLARGVPAMRLAPCTLPLSGPPPARQMATAVAAVQPGELDQAGPYAGPPPVFVTFSVYKSKGAMMVKPIKPRWRLTPGGGHECQSPGCMLFELAPAAGGSGTGPGERRYQWGDKVQVALNPLELAKIARDPGSEHSFFHDSNKGKPGLEGLLTKTLKWSPAPDGNAFFVNASSTEQGSGGKQQRSASVSVSLDELYVLQQLINGCMPYMFGFDAAFLQGNAPQS